MSRKKKDRLPKCEFCEAIVDKVYNCRVCGKDFCEDCGYSGKLICYNCAEEEKEKNPF